MHATMRLRMTIIMGLTLLYFFLLILTREMAWLRVLLVTAVPLVIALVALKRTIEVSRNTKKKNRFFWLLFSFGLFWYSLSYLILVYRFLVYQVTEPLTFSIIAQSIAYFFFFISFIYKIKTIETKVSTNSYFFTVFVFFTFAFVVNIHYFTWPIMLYVNYSIVMTVAIVLYQISALSIFFILSILFYISRDSEEKNTILFIVVGFYFLVLANILYYLFAIHLPMEWRIITYTMWVLALLFIASAPKLTQVEQKQVEWKIIKFFENKETSFPYVIVFILFILVAESYRWQLNALSIGVFVVTVIISVRQWLVMKNNRVLVKEYHYLAFHDTLTGVQNRAKFNKDLALTLEKAKEKHYSFILFLVDLDRFKRINDTLGHHIGDLVLVSAAQRLIHAFDRVGTVYRIGGDEFVVILPGVKKGYGALYANTVLHLFRKPFLIENHTLSITPSIGISVYPDDGAMQETLLQHADAAMYFSKQKGKDRYSYFNEELHQQILRKQMIELELSQAIEQGQISVCYQPKVRLETSEIIGIEALLRWNHPVLGNVSPSEFIPVAEETDQIFELGEWVLWKACQQLKDWHELDIPKLSVSINVSAKQFEQKNFTRKLQRILHLLKLDASFLELEITESTMQDVCRSIEILNELHGVGVRTAIDDFGTGYSSLYILQSLPINTIKIDRSFITNIENKRNRSIIKTMIDIGLNLDLTVVAEGIESEDQVRQLRALDCDQGQGYYYSKPVPAEQLVKLLQQIYPTTS